MHQGAIAVPAATTRALTRVSPLLLIGAGIAASGWLPSGPATISALLTVIVLGVPHGALDGELARSLLRSRFPRVWFLIFAAPYLALAAGVLLAWHLAPLPTLVLFLIASVLHFGTEDRDSAGRLDVVVHGGLPIAMAVLAHPGATGLVLGTVSRTVMVQPPAWLWAASLIWLACAATWLVRRLQTGQESRLMLPGLLACVFIVAPPVTAFAIYFVCIHAPAHMQGLIRDNFRAPRIRDVRSAALLALPVTALTLLIGAALWPLYHGPADQRLLCLTIQGLAALTLPHMLFETWLSRRVRT
ncbi:Brp/Blh family beta-carotene 15,15'-dioxygenase [Lichenicola cladoniae]|uniref:Brp/Blh family beta-carotene 15,15'-dioxygenase n=1 Tax=Lichenicola cladoniae TaxID=1484109 RepID=UPI0019533201|nr:Brp/Blh family beta-carotene 15,15'-dioxygenase [Lichenicola cladoniae]